MNYGVSMDYGIDLHTLKALESPPSDYYDIKPRCEWCNKTIENVDETYCSTDCKEQDQEYEKLKKEKQDECKRSL